MEKLYTNSEYFCALRFKSVSPYPGEKRRGISRDLADSLTIRAIYAIRTLERDRKASQNVPITAEIQLVTNEEEARLAGAPGITIVTASAKTLCCL